MRVNEGETGRKREMKRGREIAMEKRIEEERKAMFISFNSTLPLYINTL